MPLVDMCITLYISDKRMDSNELHEDEDDGPPPGWETTFPHQVLKPYEPPMQPSLAVSSGEPSPLTHHCSIHI